MSRLISTRVVEAARLLTSISSQSNSKATSLCCPRLWRSFSTQNYCATRTTCSLTGSNTTSSSRMEMDPEMYDEAEYNHLGNFIDKPLTGAIDGCSSTLQRGLNPSAHHYKGYSSDDQVDFSLFVEDPNANTMLTKVVKKGKPEQNGEVWIVEDPHWINNNDCTLGELPDPHGLTKSEIYQLHLSRVLFATSNIAVVGNDPPFAVKDFDPTEIPIQVEPGGRVDMEKLTSKLVECMLIRDGILNSWDDGPGRGAIAALMSKAHTVCNHFLYCKPEDFSYQPTLIHNVGGPVKSPGSCTVVIAKDKLDKSLHFTSDDSMEVKKHKIEIIKALDTWGEPTKFMRSHWTPDFQVGQAGTESFITGDIKSNKASTHEKRTAWNQALIGLKHSNKTYALIIWPHEAMLMKLVVQGNTLSTLTKSYPLLSVEGRIDSELVETLFHDLVLIVWDYFHSDIDPHSRR